MNKKLNELKEVITQIKAKVKEFDIQIIETSMQTIIYIDDKEACYSEVYLYDDMTDKLHVFAEDLTDISIEQLIINLKDNYANQLAERNLQAF